MQALPNPTAERLLVSQLTLEGILEDLQRQGEKESSGRFTIDPRDALPKLKHFLLPDPHAYILKWLQAAVRGGATAFRLQSGTYRVQVEIPGIRLPLERLPTVFVELLQETRLGDAALVHLAVGLHTCLGTRAESIGLEYWDGQNGLRILWQTSGQLVERWQHSGPPLCRLALQRERQERWRELKEKLHGRAALAMLFRHSSAYDNEQRLLHGTGDLAPLDVYINGRKQANSAASFRKFQGIFPSKLLFRREYCFPPGEGPGFRLGPGEQAALSFGRNEHNHYGAFAASLQRQGTHHFLLLRDGVVLRQMQMDATKPAYLLVLDGYQLSTDLTTLQFIEDDGFRHFFHKAQQFGQNPGLLTVPKI